jgi:hypothetical protein
MWVDVTICKDCVHYAWFKEKNSWWCFMFHTVTREKDYCSMGRKDEDRSW